MWYLLNAYWIPLLLAGLLGVIVGWMSCNRPSANDAKLGWFSGWVPWGIAAAALAGLAAVQTLLPGKQGLLLDTALMLFGTYMLGCCIGCILRPKPAAHLAHATAGAAKSGTSGKVATAAAVGTAATAAGIASAKSASAQNKSTTTPVADKTADTKSATTSSAGAGTNGTVVTALGAAATGVAATAAAASKGTSTGDANIKTFTSAAKFGQRPELYNAPRGGGKGDELSLIWGVAEKLEHKMNATGIWHFDQIANWSAANVEWFEHEFEGFKGRLDRDKWIEQCKKLAGGWRPDGHTGQRPKV